MNKYIYMALGLSILANVFGFNYFQSRLETKTVKIEALDKNVNDLEVALAGAKAEIKSLNGKLGAKDIEYDRVAQEYDKYKETVANIQPRTVTSVRTIIEEVPIELVVEKANESANETIRSINANAADFKRMHN